MNPLEGPSVSEFLLGMVGATPIEWAAVVLGLINVTLIVRRSVWNYPFGLAMVVLYAHIFYEYRLYSDALLQVYFFFIQIYGWWYWLHGRANDGRIIVTRLPVAAMPWYLLAAVLGTAAVGTVMDRLTDADFPYWDATIAVLSVIAQFLLSRRRLESWLVWIVVDMLAIGLFATKGLMPTAALYGVFLGLAAVGAFVWFRAWQRGEAVS